MPPELQDKLCLLIREFYTQNAASAYDENGNIIKMFQKGILGVVGGTVDNLTYRYFSSSNKLSDVSEATPVDNKLGDFTDNHSGSNDYGYDVNGNLITDLNKRLNGTTGTDLTSGGAITYNFLNLPSVIAVKNVNGSSKGTITYIYDAAGNKLEKRTNETALSKQTITTYLGGFVYENNVLQFFGHEEGRVRWTLVNGMNAFVYDYFIKDHLGNVRMVLTEEQKKDMYPAATMETAQAATEELLYANLNATRDNKPKGYPNDSYTNPNNKVTKTNGTVNKIGPSIILKVMAGDQFNIRVSSWYKKNGANPVNPKSITSDLVANLINSLTGVGGPVHGAITSMQLQNNGVISATATSFLNTQPAPGTTKPKAYLNWILLDEQFKLVSGSSSAEQVGNDQEFKVHVKSNLPVTKNGYLYVYVSNETPNVDVFFDNLQVTHIHGALLEETHYYPFGLTMAGISLKAVGTLENKYKFGGKELQANEFSDNSGI
ncbi:MAG: hypothetical protein ABI325_03270, partial [Ginsengibacter sp.]